MALWNAKGISKIKSTIDKPIDINESTKFINRLDNARVLNEIKATSVFPNTVRAKDKTGNIYQQTIKYEAVPPICVHCKCFGHKSEVYDNKVRQEVWRVKTPSPDNDTSKNPKAT